ncbi:unnamed protein product [Leuciscus chuanchicus]
MRKPFTGPRRNHVTLGPAPSCLTLSGSPSHPETAGEKERFVAEKDRLTVTQCCGFATQSNVTELLKQMAEWRFTQAPLSEYSTDSVNGNIIDRVASNSQEPGNRREKRVE